MCLPMVFLLQSKDKNKNLSTWFTTGWKIIYIHYMIIIIIIKIRKLP